MEVLGINWKILVGQIINFGILLYLLKRFAYKPFLAIFEKRKRTIEEGVKKSEEAQKKIEEIKVERERILSKAREKSLQIIKNGEEKGEKKLKEILSCVETETDKIQKEAMAKIELEKTEMKKELEGETLKLSLLLTEKILGEKLDEEKDRKIIEKFLKSLKNDYGASH